MIKVRPLFLALPLLLSGCSTLSGFSWSSLSPFNWFGSPITVSDAGVGGINAGTPLSQPVLDKALNGNYSLLSGMGIENGKLTAFYEARKDNNVMLVISGEPKGHVNKVEVQDKSIASQWGVKIGDEFGSYYSKAFDVCRLGQGNNAQSVECVAPQSKHVSYLFSGTWSGPEGLMPPDDMLKKWKVSKIIWHAQARN
ncbi:RpoE-regulated lipoprotein [Pectobacteriaceae bacterium CE70]|uniref:RpoE-regulated lipoprotein n=1 Tax=Serratia sp. (strain ATCC 39006) TaxID=104623 RepID=A0A2I5TBV6_SERS3|nr:MULTISPECIES: RpoE-regulated lipoprotein [Enterobacterales]WJV63329.1 RpoE-regulated lipoprotein [Pectobacteriaceae bacterium C52]WJV67699.1 RpoE-regulated lipoprotein [Pectobacteriaceae bacterium CE70]WJY11642.1 RpoE-regulated lipoprotein [Pectobacteriaceae bacterium C80]AUH02051.1 RpoE-regulated lipoprotein [Serratia sp. ATCC 39006]AUH06373.1 RpoE-regulated lipoprotein [Serratia sp. ATCC 39006]